MGATVGGFAAARRCCLNSASPSTMPRETEALARLRTARKNQSVLPVDELVLAWNAQNVLNSQVDR